MIPIQNAALLHQLVFFTSFVATVRKHTPHEKDMLGDQTAQLVKAHAEKSPVIACAILLQSGSWSCPCQLQPVERLVEKAVPALLAAVLH